MADAGYFVSNMKKGKIKKHWNNLAFLVSSKIQPGTKTILVDVLDGPSTQAGIP